MIEDVLRRSEWFERLPAKSREILSRSARYESFPAGTLIAREGEVGDACFLIVDGAVQALTERPDGKAIVLARCEPGRLVGEQSLLPGANGMRNASLRALSDVTVITLPKRAFQKALRANESLQQRLTELGERQLRDNLATLSLQFRSLPLDRISSDAWHREQFRAGETIFKEGAPGDRVYFIVSGSVDLFQTRAGRRQRLMQLHKGAVFGELAILQQQPRNASACAATSVHALSIDGQAFVQLCRIAPQLRRQMQSLTKVYALERHRSMTQFGGEWEGMPAVTTLCVLEGDKRAISTLVLGRDIFNLEVAGGPEATTETVAFEDREAGIERRLRIADGRIVGITAIGPWPRLGAAYRSAVEERRIDADILERFAVEGELGHAPVVPDYYGDRDTLCHCMEVDYGAIRNAIAAGATDIEQLSEATGAGTVCGSCVFSMREVLGEARWHDVSIAEIVVLTEQVRSFRLRRRDGGQFPPVRPGQHILVQACIEGHWIERPYTISTAADETRYREITVKREPRGLLSRWLFDQKPETARLRISDAQGDFCPDCTASNPVVYLVSGIGLTPALAVLRTFLTRNIERPLTIDYSAPTAAAMVARNELLAAAGHPTIDIHLRETRRDGRITTGEIGALARTKADADFYICGSRGYQQLAQKALARNGIPQARTHVEQFTPVGGSAAGQSRAYLTLGLALLGLFLVQDLFGPRWSWLRALQQSDDYRIGSGLVLLVYVASQMLLSIKRFGEDFKSWPGYYRFHKWQGALAPVFFYAHSIQFGGYGYLFWLSTLFFGNSAVGLGNPELVTDPQRKRAYRSWWLPLHVVLALALIGLLGFHAYVALAYK